MNTEQRTAGLPDGATRVDRRSLQANLWTAAQVMPPLTGLDVIRAWTGLAPDLPQGAVAQSELATVAILA